MIGYKTISEFSLQECYDMLQNEHDVSRIKELEQQYQSQLHLWHERDTLTFTKCSTIEDYENYLRYYDKYYYQSLHSDEVRTAIENLKRQTDSGDVSLKPESHKEERERDTENAKSSFTTTMAWGCLWALIAPILYLIVIAIINS